MAQARRMHLRLQTLGCIAVDEVPAGHAGRVVSCGPNQLQAAWLLGISRNALRSRLIRSGQIDTLK